MSAPALDHTDLRLLHALQVEPRASWNQLAPVVGVGAGTLARRWERISAEGLAWVTGVDTRGQLTLLEIDCDLAHSEAVAEQLTRDPRVKVLDFGSGARTLLALIVFEDLAASSQFLTHDLGALAGVRTVRSHLVSETLVDGGHWRLRALKPEEIDRVPAPPPPRSRAATRVPADVDAALMRELWADGRAPISDMAERTGISAQRLADGIATLRQSGALAFRTDIAREASDWPVYAWYFIEASGRALVAAQRSISSVPEVRLAVTSASRYNLILAVWLRQISDVSRFEIALQKALADAHIGDRSVVLRTVKHMNQRIGPRTRAVGPVHTPEGQLILAE